MSGNSKESIHGGRVSDEHVCVEAWKSHCKTGDARSQVDVCTVCGVFQMLVVKVEPWEPMRDESDQIRLVPLYDGPFRRELLGEFSMPQPETANERP